MTGESFVNDKKREMRMSENYEDMFDRNKEIESGYEKKLAEFINKQNAEIERLKNLSAVYKYALGNGVHGFLNHSISRMGWELKD